VAPGAKLSIVGGSLSSTADYALNISSGLTTGRTGTYDAGALSAVHTYFDSSSVEMSAAVRAARFLPSVLTGNGATNYTGSIRLMTASTERMRIMPSGYVGIGTNNPNSLLDVYSNTANSIMTITAASATYDPLMQFRTGVSPSTQFSMGVDTADSNKFKNLCWHQHRWHFAVLDRHFRRNLNR